MTKITLLKLANMERICLLFFFSTLFILYLPMVWLDSVYFIGCIGLCLLLGLGLLLIRHYRNVGIWILVVSLSCCWAIYQVKDLLHQQQQLHNLNVTLKQVELQIEKVLHQGDYQTAFGLLNLPQEKQLYRVYVNWQPNEQLQAGQVWQAQITLKQMAARLNAGGFQRQRWFYANRIVGNVTVKQATLIKDQPSVREQLLRFAETKISSQFAKGLLLALGFGEKSQLTTAQLQLFQQTGTAHLIAISGLHIGLVMLLGVMIGRGMQYLLPTRWITPTLPLLCGLVLATIYSYLADFSIPTIRALLALSLLLLLRLQRSYLNWWQLYLRCIALFVLFDPLILLSDSFWLSALAVLCLLLWQTLLPLSAWQWRGQALSQLGKLRYYIIALIHLQVGLMLLFTPVVLFFFSGINLQNLLINLWIVPLFSFVLIPCILTSILTFDLFNSWQWCITVAEFSIKALTCWQSTWRDLSLIEVRWVSIGCVLFCVLIASYLYFYRQTPVVQSNLITQLHPKKLQLKVELLTSHHNLARLLCFFILMLCGQLTLLGYSYYQQWQTKWSLEMLDVGQGLAILIRQGNYGILYDTGASWDGGSMAELEILPYLRRQGIHLEKIMLSHDDNDHSGGANKLFQHYPQATLFTPSQVSYADKRPLPCEQGQSFQWRALRFTILAPLAIVPTARNQHSCVVLIDDGTYRVLLTGDLDRRSELRYLASFPPVDILQVAHHGSKTSTSQPFLQQIQPKIALISSSLTNRWRFPHQEVLERLQRQQAKILNTGWDGQISVRITRNNQLEVIRQRNSAKAWFTDLPNLQRPSLELEK
ncbi:DNA internalization-related competence protein ComEC/Rec2 [Gallibacterium trehalosifermentans]|uniref:DNA internalization-related competence protein ComEC/Rec2 n=1 Tax=Gallibacterium trehalosifermentans TaxID=516935 RepID=A0ABV6H1P5_9PAST